MIEIVIENIATGEVQKSHKPITVPSGWRVKEIIKHQGPVAAKVAVWAQRFGLPVAEFSDAARWLLRQDCPYCQLASQVLKAIEELGPEATEHYFGLILKAKNANDMARLEQIREEIWRSEKPLSPTPS